jgi:hypothetical protein
VEQRLPLRTPRLVPRPGLWLRLPHPDHRRKGVAVNVEYEYGEALLAGDAEKIAEIEAEFAARAQKQERARALTAAQGRTGLDAAFGRVDFTWPPAGPG